MTMPSTLAGGCRYGKCAPRRRGVHYPICGEMRTMPGLASCAAERIDIDDDGNIVGLA
jgi:hypothetical protein